jgi:AcrR family transcriptional regulator
MKRRSPADHTRDRIVASARRVFAARPDAVASEVARDAGVSRATLHRHFRSRQDLLQAAEVEPEPGARERVLAAGIELLARDGLALLSMDELAERAGVSVNSSGYTNNLGSLRSLGLIDYPAPGLVAAQPVLFLEGVPA